MACGYSCGEEMYPGHSKKDRGATGASDRFVDPRTVAITKRAFYCLLKEGGVDTRPLMEYFTTDVPRVSDKDERFVRDAAEKLQQCVILAGKAKPEGSIAFNVQDFHQRKWDIHHGNVYGEFMSIVKTAFEDDVFNFGRFITFFCVSVSFAVYVFDRGMEDAVMSVHAWTDQAIQNNLGRYLVRCGGWVSFRFLIILCLCMCVCVCACIRV